MAHDFFHVWGGVHECRICDLRTNDPLRTVGACLTPKPATAEPPAWKMDPDVLAEAQFQTAAYGQAVIMWEAGTARVVAGVDFARPLPPTPDPIAEFNARRIAKRETTHPTEHDWPYDSGLLFSKRLCRKCGLNGADIRSATECDGAKAPKPHKPLARACRLDLHHTIHERLMPYRGHP